MSQINHPQVFLSYAHGDPTFNQWVKNFATRLLENGLEVKCDIWTDLGEDIQSLMASATDSDCIIVICSDLYIKKSKKTDGGVAAECRIFSELLRNSDCSVKIIPVLYSNKENKTPPVLNSLRYINFNNTNCFEKNFEELVRSIYREPKDKKPSIGTKPEFDKKTAPRKLLIQKDPTDSDKAQLVQNNFQKLKDYTLKELNELVQASNNVLTLSTEEFSNGFRVYFGNTDKLPTACSNRSDLPNYAVTHVTFWTNNHYPEFPNTELQESVPVKYFDHTIYCGDVFPTKQGGVQSIWQRKIEIRFDNYAAPRYFLVGSRTMFHMSHSYSSPCLSIEQVCDAIIEEMCTDIGVKIS